MSVTVRNGRYVIPVRREAQGAVGGIVHDTSATGGTLFVEPPAAVEAGNRIRELQSEEIARSSGSCSSSPSESVRIARSCATSLEALVELDSLVRARALRDRVPLRARRLAGRADGFAILEGATRCCSRRASRWCRSISRCRRASARCSSPARTPAARPCCSRRSDSSRRWCSREFPRRSAAGSESRSSTTSSPTSATSSRSSASLSTFSAHLKNLAEILGSATERSLVLIDELGSGTDPMEGAALGGAILEALTARGTLDVATTHLGALKELATEVAGRRQRVAAVRSRSRSRRRTGWSREFPADRTGSASRAGSNLPDDVLDARRGADAAGRARRDGAARRAGGARDRARRARA